MRPNVRAVRNAGFTLIELMVVTAIIGILASIAIPSFQKFALRAKTTERYTIMLRIKQAVADYYMRNGRILDSPTLYYNPPYPPTAAKRPMQPGLSPWNTYFPGNGGAAGNIGAEIEGALYYTYLLNTTDSGGVSQITVWAAGDLDNDGTVSWKTMWWTRTNGIYNLVGEAPAAGMEDEGTYGSF